MKFKVGDFVKVNKKDHPELTEYKCGQIVAISSEDDHEYPIEVTWNIYKNTESSRANYSPNELIRANSYIIKERLGIK